MPLPISSSLASRHTGALRPVAPVQHTSCPAVAPATMHRYLVRAKVAYTEDTPTVSKAYVFSESILDAHLNGPGSPNRFVEAGRKLRDGILRAHDGLAPHAASAIGVSSIPQEDDVASAGPSSSVLSSPWDIKYLYDGNCSMCLGLVSVLKRNDHKHRINYVNFRDAAFDPEEHMDVQVEVASETIHAILPDGTVVMGTEALRKLFETVGLGWAAHLSEHPLVSRVVDAIYDFLSHNRISLGSSLDAIIASKRISQSKVGVESCSHVEGCEVEW